MSDQIDSADDSDGNSTDSAEAYVATTSGHPYGILSFSGPRTDRRTPVSDHQQLAREIIQAHSRGDQLRLHTDEDNIVISSHVVSVRDTIN